MSRSIKSADDRTFPIALFDIDVDDYGLSVYEFRAYMRIVRRASGGRSSCTESLENMANACQMSRPTMVRAIRTLIQCGMIRREAKAGETSTYVLCDKSEWAPGKPEIRLPGKPEIREVDHTFTTPGKPQNHHLVNQRSTKNTNKNTTKKTTEERETRAREEVSHSRDLAVSSAQPDAVAILIEIFPDMPIFSQEVIDAAGITNLELWRTICQDWRDNRYSTRNVTGMRDRYRQQLAKLEEQVNGQNQPHTSGPRISSNERAARQTLALILGQPLDGATSHTPQLGSADAPSQQLAIMRRR
jgi:DNA-binding transcriptional regulator GbsR (MarR family)